MFANVIRGWNAMPTYRKIGGVILGIGIAIFGFWTLSPLFYDRRVDEAFPVPATAMQERLPVVTALATPATMADQVAPTISAASSMADQAAPTAMVAPAMADQAAPTAMVAPAMADQAAPTAMVAPAAPVALSAGSFVNGATPGHEAQGSATIFRLEDGQQILRLADFSATNGPDLFVVLSGSANPDQDGVKSGGFLQIDALKGNVGSQNYDLPPDIDLNQYKSVVIWCRAFNVVFGYAALQSTS
jgi:hypothetical protein